MKEKYLDAEKREKILKDMWLLHDSRWFIKVIGEFGFDAANKLNLEINKSIGRTEMKKLIKALNYDKITNAHDLKALFDIAVDLYLPEEHEYVFEVYDENTVLGKVIKCFIYKHLEKGGTTSIYKCPGEIRCKSWLEACGINGQSIAQKTAQDCNGNCTITYKITWN